METFVEPRPPRPSEHRGPRPPLRSHEPCAAPPELAFPRGLDRMSLGRHGEAVAAAHLAARGMRVIDRNVRLRRGEIDIVAIDHRTLVIVEVKTRRSLVTGVPQAAVTAQKLRRMRVLTGMYLEEHSPRHVDIRLDVVAVLVSPDGTALVEHLVGVGE